MSRDTPAIRSPIDDDQPCRDRPRQPATLGRDSPRQAALSIERAEQFVHIEDLGLELDDQERPRGVAPGQEVDHAALAVHRERHLGGDRPIWPVGAEPAGDGLVERRVGAVEEAIQFAAPPQGNRPNLDLEGGGDPARRVELERAGVPTLNPRDRRPGDACSMTELGLRPVPPTTRRPNRCTEPEVVHSGMIPGGPYRRLSTAELGPLRAAEEGSMSGERSKR